MRQKNCVYLAWFFKGSNASIYVPHVFVEQGGGCLNQHCTCVTCTFSHSRQTHRNTMPLPDLHRGWSGSGKKKTLEDKKQLSIQNSQAGLTNMEITYRQMTERNIDLTQEIISGLEKGGGKKKAGHLQRFNFRSLSFLSLSGEHQSFQQREEQQGKIQKVEMNRPVHQKLEPHVVFICHRPTNHNKTLISSAPPSRNNPYPLLWTPATPLNVIVIELFFFHRLVKS